jgi:hypothetical protein
MANEYRKRKLIGIFRKLAKQSQNMQVALDAAVWLVWLEGFAGELTGLRRPSSPHTSKDQPIVGLPKYGITYEQLQQLLSDPAKIPDESPGIDTQKISK